MRDATCRGISGGKNTINIAIGATDEVLTPVAGWGSAYIGRVPKVLTTAVVGVAAIITTIGAKAIA